MAVKIEAKSCTFFVWFASYNTAHAKREVKEHNLERHQFRIYSNAGVTNGFIQREGKALSH